MLDYEQRTEYFDFVNEMLDTDFNPRTSRCIASVGDEIKGVVVFSRFSAFNCEWTAASHTPYFLTRALVRACFRYAFVQCELNRVTAIVDERNTRSQRLLLGIGFEKECDLQGMFGESNGVLFKMLKHRWLDGKRFR